MSDREGRYGIGEVSARTGVPIPVLRSWESRYGFPVPERLEGGHRRYSEQDVRRLVDVVRERAAGISLATAIERARSLAAETDRTLFAALRRARPGIQPLDARVPVMRALSRAIEDEVLARAERAVLFGSFQRVRAYEAARGRWRELAKVAEATYVLADFEGPRSPRGEPVEIAIDREDPIAREWSVVADGPGFGAVLAGWERPADGPSRRFECVWSIEPEVVRDASRLAAELAERAGGKVELPARLQQPAVTADPAVRELSRLAQRMVGYVAAS